MSTESSAEKSAINGIRTALGVGGVLAIIAGLFILVWPAQGRIRRDRRSSRSTRSSPASSTRVSGIFSKQRGGWSRVGHIALGVLFIIAGIVALANLHADHRVARHLPRNPRRHHVDRRGNRRALHARRRRARRCWSIIFAIISIIAGIVLLFSPLWGAAVLWWLLGIALVVLGIINVVRAFTFKGEY